MKRTRIGCAVAVGDDGTIRVKVPMFYRVRGEAEPVGPDGQTCIEVARAVLDQEVNDDG